MKKLFLSLISMMLAGSPYAQLNSFQEGDVLSADKMNENFESLINSNALRSTSVNCDEGETINGAIESGYNEITVSGTCNENLLYTVWRDSASEGAQPTGKMAPRYLKISGETSDANIIDASASTESTISLNSGTTLFLENITVSGGKYGVAVNRNSNLLISGVTVKNFSERGLQVDDSSYLGVDEGGLTLTGAAGADRGIHLATGSSGWIENMTVSGVNYGLYMLKSGMFLNGAIVEGGESGFVLDLSSHLTIYGDDKPVSISNVNNSGIGIWSNSHLTLAEAAVLGVSGGNKGIEIGSSSALNSGGLITISKTSDRAISVSDGGFSNWNGSVTVSELIGGRGIVLQQSNAIITNLKILDFSSEGKNPAVDVSSGSVVSLNQVEISGSSERTLLNFDRSNIGINNLSVDGTITGGEDVLVAFGQSTAEIGGNSNITGSAKTLLSIWNSKIGIYNTSIEGEAANEVISVGSSQVDLKNGSIVNSTDGGGIYLSRASMLLMSDAVLSAKKNGLNINDNSYAELQEGTAVSATEGFALRASRGSGFRIKSGVSGLSTGNTALILKVSSYAEISGEQTLINRTDDGFDAEVSEMSYLLLYGGKDVIEDANCGGKSLISVDMNSITNDLPDSCKE